MMSDKLIQVFIRHCYYSKLQELPDRSRPFWFSKEFAFKNFKDTINLNLADYHIIYDEYYGSIDKTFLKDEKNVKIINCGSECESFIETINFIKSKKYSNDTIIYLLEDDYIHRDDWCKIILEGFSLNCDYLTLYDFDFFSEFNKNFELYLTKNSYWKSIHSTTNTFACKYSTLIKDFDVHVEYSTKKSIRDAQGYFFSSDDKKFNFLSQKLNRKILSTLPGFSTQCTLNKISPTINWEKILNRKISNVIKFF